MTGGGNDTRLSILAKPANMFNSLLILELSFNLKKLLRSSL